MSSHRSGDSEPLAELRAFVEAERSGRPFLLFSDAEHRQQLFLLSSDAEAVSVGRRPSSDVVLDWDNQVSRTHARFEKTGDGWELVDDGLSSNGTFVNDERLSERRRLNDGDTLRFGSTTVTFHAPKPPRATASAVAERAAPGADAAAPEAERAVPRPEPAPQAPEPAPQAPEPAPQAPEPAVPVELSSTQRRVLVALCRPYKDASSLAVPTGDDQIADELVLSVGEVRAHLRVLAAKLGVPHLPESETRTRIAERALAGGLISDRDL
jgi:FHA domain